MRSRTCQARMAVNIFSMIRAKTDGISDEEHDIIFSDVELRLLVADDAL